MIIEAGAVFRNATLEPGWIEVRDGRIEAVGGGSAPTHPDCTYPEHILCPGFVDVHAHGGGGASFSTTSDADIDVVLASHRRHGTTTMVASLVTASDDDLRRQVGVLSRRVQQGDLAGIHLEGPWLNRRYKGAHEEALLRDPDPVFISELLTLASGAIKMVTLAPELDKALDAVQLFTANGVVVAVGHTNCTYDQAQGAIRAGATGATHLFNAMAPLHHREPGPNLALLTDERVHVELVFDNVHVHPDLGRFVLETAGQRGVLVTDAMAATGQPDGDYTLGNLAVQVADGIAKLAGTETIAGSTLTLDKAVRNAVQAGLRLEEALAAATERPAAFLGLSEVGRLEPGLRADLVLLDKRNLQVAEVLQGGVSM